MRTTRPDRSAGRSFLLPAFILLTAAGCIASYGTDSLPLKVSTIVAAFAILLWVMRRTPVLPAPAWEKGFRVLPWVWVVLFAFAVFLRFLKLDTLSSWPLYDEAKIAYFGVLRSEGSPLRPFYTYGQHPFPYISLEALFFRHFGVSLRTLWLTPAVMSLVSLSLFGWMVTRMVGRMVAFIATVMAVFGFWPLLLGRLNVNMNVTTIIWEISLFILLAGYLRQDRRMGGLGEGFLWGLFLGVGCYTYHYWFAPFLAAFVPLIASCMKRRGVSWKPVLGLLLGCVFAWLPFFLVFIPSGYGSWVASQRARWDLEHLVQRGIVIGRYLACMFNGYNTTSVYRYTPIWGGFLNPVMSVLVLLGYITCVFEGKDRMERWLIWALPIQLVPGIFSTNLLGLRIITAWPLALLVASLGLARMIRGMHPIAATRLAVMLLVLSAGLDLHHLFGRYHEYWAKGPENWTNKSRSAFNSYRILAAKARESGPGLILTGFATTESFLPNDLSLDVAVWDINTARRSGAEARWGALITDEEGVREIRLLDPDGEAFAFQGENEKVRHVLWICPMGPANRDQWERWRIADGRMQGYIKKTYDLFTASGEECVRLGILSGMEPTFRGDAFLRVVFWRMVSEVCESWPAAFTLARWAGTMERMHRGIRPPPTLYMGYHLPPKIGCLFDTLQPLLPGAVKSGERPVQAVVLAPLKDAEALDRAFPGASGTYLMAEPDQPVWRVIEVPIARYEAFLKSEPRP